MWNWLKCYLSGCHEFGVSCEPGAIFLRCIHCGKRSCGWELEAHYGRLPAKPRIAPEATRNPLRAPLPFTPRGVGRLHSA